MTTAFGEYRFDRDRLRECHFPVFLGYGDLTDEHEEAAILARLLPDTHIRRFSGIHHFSAGAQNLGVRQLAQEPVDEGGLAYVGGAVDQDDFWLARANVVKLGRQDGEVLAPTDKWRCHHAIQQA